MNEELHHLVGAYALDALDTDERAAFEAHLGTCELCRADLVEFRATAAEIAVATRSTPPADLKARVMAGVATTRQVSPVVPDRVVDLAERRRRNVARPRLLAAIAAAVVFVAGIAGAASLVGRSADPAGELAEAGDAIVVDLESAEGAPGTIRVVWSPEEDRANVIGDGLADAGTDRAYALWFLNADGTVAPAGLFTPDDGEVDVTLDLDDIDGIGWGITIEPSTGSEQPTTPVIYSGTV